MTAIPVGTEKNLEQAIIRQKSLAHEMCIRKALKELLDREPTIDDARLCSQEFNEDGCSYILSYNKIRIGTVKIVDEPSKYRVEFVPLQKAN